MAIRQYGLDTVTGRRVEVRPSRIAGAVQIRNHRLDPWCAVRAETIVVEDEPDDHQPILPPRDGRPTSLPTYSDDRPF